MAKYTISAPNGKTYTIEGPSGASQEQVQTIWNMTPDEFKKMMESLQTGERNFAIDEKRYETWRQFWVSLKEAGNIIENSLIRNLEKLTPQLKQLATTIANTIDELLNSKEFAEAMDTINQGIKDFGKYLVSGEAKEDMHLFLEALKALSKSPVCIRKIYELVDGDALSPAVIESPKAIIDDVNIDLSG